MAEDVLKKTEYHFTPQGWVLGTETLLDNRTERRIPENRIETWVREECQRSIFSAAHVTWHLAWPLGGNAASNKRLRDKFGPPEKDFPVLDEESQ